MKRKMREIRVGVERVEGRYSCFRRGILIIGFVCVGFIRYLC